MPSNNDRDIQFRRLEEVLDKYRSSRGQLIRILHEAQNIFGCLPEEVQTYIAGRTGIPVSEVNGVVTFYSLFNTRPKGKYTIRVCLGTACYVQGNQEIIGVLSRELGIESGNTTADGLFSLESTRCVGACGLAPVITVNDRVHGRVNSREALKILRQYGKLGEADHKSNDQRNQRPAGNQEEIQASP